MKYFFVLLVVCLAGSMGCSRRHLLISDNEGNVQYKAFENLTDLSQSLSRDKSITVRIRTSVDFFSPPQLYIDGSSQLTMQEESRDEISVTWRHLYSPKHCQGGVSISVHFYGASEQFYVRLEHPIASVSIVSSLQEGAQLGSFFCEAVVTDMCGDTVFDPHLVWSCSDPEIAEIDQSGTVRLKGINGKASITAECGGKKDTLTFEATTVFVEPYVCISPGFIRLKEGTTFQPLAKLVCYNQPDIEGNKSFLWKSSNHSIAVVDDEGKIFLLSPGDVEITASFGKYSRKIYITVEPAAKSLSESSTEIEKILVNNPK